MAIDTIIFFCAFLGIALSVFFKGADLLSPTRVFGATWSLALGLTSLKLSALQHVWSTESWILLLIGIGAFLVGNMFGSALNLNRELRSLESMRAILRMELFDERRLFTLLVISTLLYFISYIVIYLVKGFLPLFVVGTKIARTEFYVFGFGVLINSTAFISFFALMYLMYVRRKLLNKLVVVLLAGLALGSYFLLLQRFQVVMAAVIALTFVYYGTRYFRIRTILPLTLGVVAFFYWISSLRLQQLFSFYMYQISKMKFSREFALVAEPYMYVVMNLENFARTVDRLDHYTFGYFTFDFVTALSGLKYWIVDYFALDRSPYLISGYNTYSAFWYFYRDFGVLGLAVIPFLLGFAISLLYYEMRANPSAPKVAAYGIMVFVMIISFFHFPIAFLWFEYNMLMFLLFFKIAYKKALNRVRVE